MTRKQAQIQFMLDEMDRLMKQTRSSTQQADILVSITATRYLRALEALRELLLRPDVTTPDMRIIASALGMEMVDEG